MNATNGSGQVFGGLLSERTQQIVAKVLSNETSRQNKEDETLRMIAKTDSSSIQTELYQTITKMNQISKKHHILDSLMEVRASSHTHC
jgi:vacuolar-type H+-ATPase catalytic subunit A/Vma1